MRVSKNRQSGFIKNSSSLTNLQSHRQPQYGSKDNESFSKFDEQFSSFVYKYPQDESQNQFSLFVFNQHQKSRKVSKGIKKGAEINLLKENDSLLNNKVRNETVKEHDKFLEEDEQPQTQMQSTHIKFNQKNNDAIKRITTNYYSATTTYAKANKIGADTNNAKKSQLNSYADQKVHEDQVKRNYTTQATSPRTNLKEVGKLRKTSKEHMSERHPIQFSKKYQEDMYENGEEYYRERAMQSQRPGLNALKRVKSDEKLFGFRNAYTEEYVPRSFAKKHSKQETKGQTFYQKGQTFYQSGTRKSSPNYILEQEPQVIVRKNYKEVSESSVIESEPSFLKERLEEVERRKLQLLQKKRQLEELKRKSLHVMQEQNPHFLNYPKGSRSDQNVNPTNKSRKIDQNKSRQPKVYQVASLNEESDQEGSLSSESQQTSQQKDDLEESSQSITESDNQASSNHQFASNHTPPSEVGISNRKYQQAMQVNQHDYHQPSSPLSHIPKSAKNVKSPANISTHSLHTDKKSYTVIKTTPLQIIKQIEKRSDQLKQQQLRQMYEKEGISVAKGGVSFDINTKDFIFPEKDTDTPNIHISPSQSTQHKQTIISKESAKNNSNKNKPKINSKQQLKRRRQLAKSYDRYARNIIFGAY